MKKVLGILLIILACAFFVGCDVNVNTDKQNNENSNSNNQQETSVNYTQLTKLNYSTYNERCILDEGDMNSVNQFAINTMNELISENITKNTNLTDIFYSPASFYMALSLLTEGASDKAYEELINLLECASLEDLQKNNSVIYKNNNLENTNSKIKMANSIWVRNDKDVKTEYINKLINEYYAETYKGEMDQKTIDAIAKWINDNTFDFLNVKGEDLRNLVNDAFVLVNTIYFKSVWETEYYQTSTYDMKFNGTTMIPFMHHTADGFYYDMTNFTVASDSFYDGYKIYYVLPKEKHTIQDCLNEELTNVVLGHIRYKEKLFNFAVPKFKYQNSLDLVPLCKNLGVNEIFNNGSCLSKITDDVVIASIDQIAGINLNENGVEAAAATIIGAKDECVGPEETIDFVLDRPFLYYIVDTNNTIMFMGTCVDPKC